MEAGAVAAPVRAAAEEGSVVGECADSAADLASERHVYVRPPQVDRRTEP